MAGFGWSAGDIVLAAKFVVKVGTALKDSGGASEDYQQSAIFLLSLEQTLTSLASFECLLPQDASADVISSQARIVAETLNTSINSIEKFEVPKLQWAVFVSEKAKELQSNIAMPITTININLGLQAMHSIRTLQSTLPPSICDQVAKCIDQKFPSQLRFELWPSGQATEALYDSCGRNLSSADHGFTLQSEIERTLQANLDQSVTQCTTDMELLQAQPSATGSFAAPQENIAKCFYVLVAAIKQLLRELIVLLWPQILLFARKLQVVLQVPRLILGDSIFFEDALGRTRNLPFEYFRSWDILLPYLVRSFRGVPGYRRVFREQYHLIDGANSEIIDKHYWETKIRPQSRVTMAITTTRVRSEKVHCPRCDRPEYNPQLDTNVVCRQCNANYRSFEPALRIYFRIGDEHMSPPRPRSVPSSVSLYDPATVANPLEVIEMPGNTQPGTDSTDMTCFKRIHSVSTIDPVAITDKIEEMLDTVVQMYWHKISDGVVQTQARETDIQQKISKLRYTLSVIKTEAIFNLFDIFSELLSHILESMPLIESLQQIIGLYHHTRSKPLLSFQDAIDSYVGWAMQMIPAAYLDEPSASVTWKQSTWIQSKSCSRPEPEILRVPWSSAFVQPQLQVHGLQGVAVNDKYSVYEQIFEDFAVTNLIELRNRSSKDLWETAYVSRSSLKDGGVKGVRALSAIHSAGWRVVHGFSCSTKHVAINTLTQADPTFKNFILFVNRLFCN